MYHMLCILMATIAYGTAAGYCQAPGAVALTFESSTYSDFRQLLAGEAATGAVKIRADLSFPEEKKDRYPAVIVVHTISGYRDANEGYAAAELRRAGFATFIYDSFAARGTTGMAMSALPGYLPAGVADAYAALRLLANEPRIDQPWELALLSGLRQYEEMPSACAWARGADVFDRCSGNAVRSERLRRVHA